MTPLACLIFALIAIALLVAIGSAIWPKCPLWVSVLLVCIVLVLVVFPK